MIKDNLLIEPIQFLLYPSYENSTIAPFVSIDVLEKIINAKIEKNNFKEIRGLLPFSGKNMEEMMTKEIRNHFKKSYKS